MNKKQKPKILIALYEKEAEQNPQLSMGRLTEYECPENELNVVHVELEKIQWSGGVKRSRPFIQKFNPRAFDQFVKNAAGLGFKWVKVWHDPNYVEDFSDLEKQFTHQKGIQGAEKEVIGDNIVKTYDERSPAEKRAFTIAKKQAAAKGKK